MKCLVLSTKRLVAAEKILVKATKNSFVVPNFVAVTKPFVYVTQVKLSEMNVGCSLVIQLYFRNLGRRMVKIQ